MSKIDTSEFQKSLNRLESLAKSQLHHTPSDSNPGTWAGTSQEDQDESSGGSDINIDDNGTDYDGVKKALGDAYAKGRSFTPAEAAIVKGEDPRPHIANKISKGEALTNAESWAIKGGVEKMMYGLKKGADKPGPAGTPGEAKDANTVPDSHAGENEDDEIEQDAKKSLDAVVSGSDTLRKGIEMSPFLYEFTRGMGQALTGTEARVRKSVMQAVEPLLAHIQTLEKALVSHIGEQGEFNKSLADAVIGMGQTLNASAEFQAEQAQQPARGPRSQFTVHQGGQAPQGVQPLQKSFAPGGFDQSLESLTKAQMATAMTDMVMKGQLNASEVVKFESTGQVSPQTQQAVLSFVSGANQ